MAIDTKDMDAATTEAHNELMEHVDGWSALELIQWWQRWYMKAGHKRLGRVLVSLAKVDGRGK